MGFATLFVEKRGISNPILHCTPESPKSLETTGIAGRCDPEVGSIATPPPFSCFLFDPGKTTRNPWLLGPDLLCRVSRGLGVHTAQRCNPPAICVCRAQGPPGAVQRACGRWLARLVLSAERITLGLVLWVFFLIGNLNAVPMEYFHYSRRFST